MCLCMIQFETIDIIQKKINQQKKLFIQLTSSIITKKESKLFKNLFSEKKVYLALNLALNLFFAAKDIFDTAFKFDFMIKSISFNSSQKGM